MLSFKAVALVLLLTLSACGFSPMYGEHAAAKIEQEYDNIDISNIPDRDGQTLRNLLIDRFYTRGRPDNAAYILRIEPLTKTVRNMGIRKDANYTRGEMQFNAHMALIDRASGQVILRRDLRTVGGYNLLDNQFATIISERDLTERLLAEMSDNIQTELALFFNRQAKK